MTCATCGRSGAAASPCPKPQPTGLEFLESYGMTETIAPATANPPHRPKPQCVGIPVFNADSFVQADGERFPRSGDLWRLDGQGYLYILDRLTCLINASGYKVWPTAVEVALCHHPAIAEACVIGATDSHRGETIKAVVVLKPGAGMVLWRMFQEAETASRPA